MGVIAGIIGASGGVLIVVAVAAYQIWTPVLDPAAPFLAPVVGGAIGLVSGTYPALRAAKIDKIAENIKPVAVDGPESGDLLVLGWGSTYGAIRAGTRNARREGYSVAHAHIRHLNPFAPNLAELFSNYDKILVPELNPGHLAMLLRSEFLVDARVLSKNEGQPFKVSEIRARIEAMLRGED